MALPQLTDAQRSDALAKAKIARAERATLKQDLTKGAIDLADLFAMSDDGNDIAGKLKVVDALQALPKIGKVRAAAIMEAESIAPSRRIRGLGSKQRAALLERFGTQAK